MAADLELVSTRARATRVGLWAYASLIYVFLFAPIVLLVLFSFNANRYGTFPITALDADLVPRRPSATSRSTTRS